MDENDFDTLFPEGLSDYSEEMLTRNFSMKKQEIQNLIESSYKKEDGKYLMERENPVILSIMRALDISLEDMPLFTPEEILAELNRNPASNAKPAIDTIFPLLVASLDSVFISHDDGMVTNLHLTEKGDLKGIFHPAGKPWTRILIPGKI